MYATTTYGGGLIFLFHQSGEKCPRRAGVFHRSFRDQSHVTEIVSGRDRYPLYIRVYARQSGTEASRHRSSRNRATSEFQVRAYIAIGYRELPGALTGTRRGNLTSITL